MNTNRTTAKWLGKGVLILVGLVLLASGAAISWDRMHLPTEPDAAQFIQKAATYNAKIARDHFGVPHISGPRDVDVAFGLAYAHAEDDYPTIQDVTLATRGTLAAVKGPSAATTDYLVRLLQVWEPLKTRYETELPQDVRAVMQAYADGLNYYAALHPATTEAHGLLPYTGRDVAAGFIFKLPFFFGLDKELQRITASTASDKKPPQGSNGLAVAPSRSSDGATRLLINSHQPYTGPVAWYEAVLESGEGWHVAGGFFPGSPFMLHGHNEHLGWAHTVNAPHLIDTYRLTINPANPDQYLLDGVWRNFEIGDAAIRVKLLGPLIWTFHQPLLHSAHGPVFRTDHGVFAVRYAGMGDINQSVQYFRENKAENLAQWRAAVNMNALPSLNYIYADEKGHIGYIYNGRYPKRKEGVDWTVDLPGDRSDLIWTSYLPASKVPQIWDPKSGYVFNSNNTPFDASAQGDQLLPENFSPTMGLETRMNNRALRVEETVGTDLSIDDEAFHRYKYDVQYSERSAAMRMINQLKTMEMASQPELKPAQEVLKQWNGSADRNNRQAALALLTVYQVLSNDDNELMPPIEGLRKTAEQLQKNFGRLDPAWGEVNRIDRGNSSLGIDGARDTYRSVWGEAGKNGRLSGVAGDTLIMFVSWDKNGHLKSESVHQFGSATLDESSPHFADQLPLFVEEKTKPVLFTQAQQQGQMEEIYAPGQRGRLQP